ncbi:F4 family fimbrial subunit [Escherichia albertii]|uniref:F4 family fimbrial subunit n=1 Tax=Escherichia albertii TaxID=208962 RepID=UPI0011EC3FCE|nr:hypothetical protein [Escherichia albertii]
MKKTLMALAIAVSTVSGSTMAAAWVQGGGGGSLQLGGTLTPQEKPTEEWQTSVGGDKLDLDANVERGATQINVSVSSPIPVLGIRFQTKSRFRGHDGISPQIDYHGAIDLSSFRKSEALLSLAVRDSTGSKIGSLSVPLLVGSEVSRSKMMPRLPVIHTISEKFGVIANKKGDAFFGGLPISKDGTSSDAVTRVGKINPDFIATYDDQGGRQLDFAAETFKDKRYLYSAFYGAGIEAGKSISIKLDKPIDADSIKWTASLPITVTYI